MFTMVRWWKKHPDKKEQKLIFFLSKNWGALQFSSLPHMSYSSFPFGILAMFFGTPLGTSGLLSGRCDYTKNETDESGC